MIETKTTHCSTNKSPGFIRQCVEFILLLLLMFTIRSVVYSLYQVPTGSMETTMLVGERFFADKFTYFFRDPKRGEIVAIIQPHYKFSKNKLVAAWQRYVWGPENWTKRIIGKPGDYVRGVIENGQPVIYINNEKLSEPYLNKYPLIKTLDSAKTFDPDIPFDKQPFYKHIDQKRVIRDAFGNPELIYPTEARRSKTTPQMRGNRFWDGSDEFSVQLANDEYWLMGDNRKGSSDSRVFGPIKKRDIFARIHWCILSVDSNQSWLVLDILKNPIAFWNNLRPGRSLKAIN
jgi:signal peptidase I